MNNIKYIVSKDQIYNKLHNTYVISSILIYLKPIILHALLSCSNFEKWCTTSQTIKFAICIMDWHPLNSWKEFKMLFKIIMHYHLQLMFKINIFLWNFVCKCQNWCNYSSQIPNDWSGTHLGKKPYFWHSQAIPGENVIKSQIPLTFGQNLADPASLLG